MIENLEIILLYIIRRWVHMKIVAKEAFQTVRVKKGFSINGLAREMRVNASVVFHMEKGGSVRPGTAKKACSALGENFELLFIIKDGGKNR